MGSISPAEPPPKSHPFKKVLIVGSGPAGLLLALLLAQHHIPVVVLEAWSGLDTRLRATQYGTPASRIFRKAGVLDDIRAIGIQNFKGIYWRTVRDGKKLASVDLSLTQDDPDRITVLPLSEILQILYRHCQKFNIEVKFDHKVVNVRQNESKAWVEVEVGQENGGDATRETFEADYVIGCDGATSRVRQELFGREWPGVTWDHALLVQNVRLRDSCPGNN
jgi:2-polyprenyl-6-methoxyphenol hydroxylase-like FAD-dependent oxidoreductase